MAPSNSWKVVAVIRAWPDCITLDFGDKPGTQFALLLRRGRSRSLGRTKRRHEPVVYRARGHPQPGRRILDLCEHSRNEGEQFDPARIGLDHLALEAASLDELQAWATWVDTCGVARSAVREVADGRGSMFDFVDPDGIQIEFTQLNLG